MQLPTTATVSPSPAVCDQRLEAVICRLLGKHSQRGVIILVSWCSANAATLRVAHKCRSVNQFNEMPLAGSVLTRSAFLFYLVQ